MKYNVAVIGATGLVGSMMLKVLSEKNFPIDNLFLLHITLTYLYLATQN